MLFFLLGLPKSFTSRAEHPDHPLQLVWDVGDFPVSRFQLLYIHRVMEQMLIYFFFFPCAPLSLPSYPFPNSSH